MCEIKIITWGSRIGSPYPWRRKFVIKIERSIKDLVRWTDDFYDQLMSFYEIVPCKITYFDFIEYTKFCKYCTNELCLRHRSLNEATSLIGNESNHQYVYTFRYDGKTPIAELILGGSHWNVVITPTYAIVKRPSGLTFRYNAHKNYKKDNGYISSHLYISQKLIEWLYDIINLSYKEIIIS